ncbi:MAG: hypothetical protein EKK63_09065 [Acinetobacter sp.]|uniref:hypothetical protein n=1 Tax=Acinetobacter sp. TaxID=472 RepID=UPI000FA9EECF|nr:hypothetical protein [Acinetobacter sp.]RUP39778.1 MAG: hypothetical protein EKK63_09065 [Acinetobacter sp.]
MRLNIELDKLQKRIKNTQTKYLLNPDIDVEVYNSLMTDMRTQESSLLKQIADQGKDTANITGRIDAVMPRLTSLKDSFHSFDLVQKQLFLKVVLSGQGSYNGQFWTTAGIHPMFADNLVKLKALGILEIKKAPVEDAFLEGGTGEPSIGQLFDELVIALAV